MRKIFAALVIGGLAASAVVAQGPRPSPDLQIEMPGDKDLALQSLRGKVVLVAFLSTT